MLIHSSNDDYKETNIYTYRHKILNNLEKNNKTKQHTKHV